MTATTDTTAPDQPEVLGWRETVSLPDWGISAVIAKLDTGARTSSIHARKIEHLDDGRVRFEVIVRDKPRREAVTIIAEPVREAVVKPKPGTRQRRLVFETTLQLGEHRFVIELNLVNRKGMLSRMLLGRTALAGRFVVDPDRKHVGTRRPRRPRRPPEAAKTPENP